MNLEIVTPDKIVFEGEAELVQLPGLDGSFEVLDHHMPMIAGLAKGKVKVIDANKNENFYDIKGGVLEVVDNKVMVLAQ
ncbi:MULTISPECIES: ATP synthase F1 subunit epsilon [unclassified Lentimicrobium]|uniref:ATP synthase F1 subunit epsilon n=1 Tax=unclassified Lentimicrobium TaxID=2677434 RepID=UPI0015580E5D|nr:MULTISPECIES: ATP synthase F1 subunit epsilon [unclassified Lentimicrobium]NPD47215.1 ATP synthase F1 subunit epsilon [Lentimicrobium sp. S6]NPD84862.1 ATP synthase F1 subunit epsilon [Lentimicrobium sp. L6]